MSTLLLGWVADPPKSPLTQASTGRLAGARLGPQRFPLIFIFIKAPRELHFSYAQPAWDSGAQGPGSNQ